MDDPLDCSEATATCSRTWEMRQNLSEEKWDSARPNLLNSMLSSQKITSKKCDHCNMEMAMIRCRDCLPKQRFCCKCDVAIHKQLLLHNRETVVEGFYEPVPPTTFLSVDCTGAYSICEQACLLPTALPTGICNCGPGNITISTGRAIILVTINGRYDLSLPLFTCKSCSKSWTPGLNDLQDSGYWPGNVAFQTLYTIDLFQTFDEMKITAPGLSRQAFVKMLNQRTSSFGRAGCISGDNLQRSFLEWTYCRHEKEKLLNIQHFSCSACADNMSAVSIDGNRKMYRFSRTTGGAENAFFNGDFLAKDKEVEEFVEMIRNEVTLASGKGLCGKTQWRAARETAKKSGSKVDEEGVDVAVCRHGILLKALNMFRGEIFAYPLFLHKELARVYDIDFICTDIMCKYYPYLQKVCHQFPYLQTLLRNKPFLSVMHAKGHSGKCEVQWGGRNQEGAGMTVGEEVEQVNSFLSRVALTTKYMTKPARNDMITIQARGWNVNKKKNLHKYLSRRYVKILQRKNEEEQDLQILKERMNISDEDLVQWVKDVQEWAAATPTNVSPEDGPGLQRVIESLALSIQQKKHDKYRQNDSSKARHRINIQIQKEKKKLCDAIGQYNMLVPEEEAVAAVDIILAAECPLWPWDKESDIPLKEKKKVFDKVMHLRRLREEDGILLREMKQHWQSLCRYSSHLKENIARDAFGNRYTSDATEGLQCILKCHLQTTKKIMAEVQCAYRSLVTNECVLEEEEDDGQEEEDMSESEFDDSDTD